MKSKPHFIKFFKMLHKIRIRILIFCQTQFSFLALNILSLTLQIHTTKFLRWTNHRLNNFNHLTDWQIVIHWLTNLNSTDWQISISIPARLVIIFFIYVVSIHRQDYFRSILSRNFLAKILEDLEIAYLPIEALPSLISIWFRIQIC